MIMVKYSRVLVSTCVWHRHPILIEVSVQQKYDLLLLQMGSKFKKTIISENVRRSLHGWQTKVKTRQESPGFALLTATSTSSLASLDEEQTINETIYTEESSEEHGQNIV